MELLPELKKLNDIVDGFDGQLRSYDHGQVSYNNRSYPLHSFSIGTEDPSAPCLAFSGGVHGLERIGTQLVINFLRSTLQRLKWDEDFVHLMGNMRLAFFPLVNPIGMANLWRANANGVDLMRNAPIDAEDATFMVGGQRISPFLPWYRGKKNEMEIETKALDEFIRRECFDSKFALSIDCHSGFGTKDQLWYPFAYSHRPFPHEKQVHALKDLLEEVNPYHPYVIEPQAANYTTHGDIWDLLYLERHEKNDGGVYLPLTLEMGSWSWVKKNPWQIFSRLGAFNPVKRHRYERAMRRHFNLLEFLMRATRNHHSWCER